MPSVPSVAVEAGQQVAKGFERARHAAAPCRERWRSALTMEAEASHLAATKRAVRERRVVKDFRRSIVDFGV
jgi:hypothetical protein